MENFVGTFTCKFIGNLKLRQLPSPIVGWMQAPCYVICSVHFAALIILLYLFRQERDELGQYPAKTFVVPRCLATCKP